MSASAPRPPARQSPAWPPVIPGFPVIPQTPPPRPAAPKRKRGLIHWPVVLGASGAAVLLVAGALVAIGPRSERRPAASRVAPPSSAAPLTCAVPPVGATHGTSVTFLPTPAQASRQAEREGKLVFLLHVSGDFEEARFT
jgi:hypothetical protein